jgi:hypothetical protein
MWTSVSPCSPAYFVDEGKHTRLARAASATERRDANQRVVGRCTFTVSTPVLKAHMVSALEAEIL